MLKTFIGVNGYCILNDVDAVDCCCSC